MRETLVPHIQQYVSMVSILVLFAIDMLTKRRVIFNRQTSLDTLRVLLVAFINLCNHK